MTFYLKNLPDDVDGAHYCQFITDSQDIESMFDMIAFPDEYKNDITAIMAYCYDGEILAIFLSESGRYYDINSWYRPLTYYRPESWNTDKLPCHWQDNNEYYI